MSRSKKPGAPGKTTIPREVVSAVTKRIQAAFKKRGCDEFHYVFVIPQQCYLYVETQEKPSGPFGTQLPKPKVTTSSTTHNPLGRLRYLGNADRWEFQPYRWSDECWDDEECIEVGPLEELMERILRAVA